ncbi:GNAT family N-acetyltransferase [Salinibaculum rarum]|uniref:GNAT family N-acetyltransferase n=1 Tax=Salinibaculum rarum TaxID=3058903 RepID=UPI00265EB538|nr:GNAT family protein [Salinibaculum sp. KK48]
MMRSQQAVSEATASKIRGRDWDVATARSHLTWDGDTGASTLSGVEIEFECTKRGSETVLNVYHFWLDEKLRGYGIARCMHDALLEIADEADIDRVLVTVQASSSRVERFLRRAGYELLGPYPHRRYDNPIIEGELSL